MRRALLLLALAGCNFSPVAGGTSTLSGKCDPECGSGETCVNRKCVCDPETCQGCCAAERCLVGTEREACGAHGESCSSCDPRTDGPLCSGQKCGCIANEQCASSLNGPICLPSLRCGCRSTADCIGGLLCTGDGLCRAPAAMCEGNADGTVCDSNGDTVPDPGNDCTSPSLCAKGECIAGGVKPEMINQPCDFNLDGAPDQATTCRNAPLCTQGTCTAGTPRSENDGQLCDADGDGQNDPQTECRDVSSCLAGTCMKGAVRRDPVNSTLLRICRPELACFEAVRCVVESTGDPACPDLGGPNGYSATTKPCTVSGQCKTAACVVTPGANFGACAVSNVASGTTCTSCETPGTCTNDACYDLGCSAGSCTSIPSTLNASCSNGSVCSNAQNACCISPGIVPTGNTDACCTGTTNTACGSLSKDTTFRNKNVCVAGICGDDCCGPTENLGNCGPDCSCFLGSMRVRMADGTEMPIQYIDIGDEVLTWDFATRTHHARKVTAVNRNNLWVLGGDMVLLDGKLWVTPNHGIYANGKKIPAGDIDPGMSVHDFYRGPVPVRSYERAIKDAVVYNLAVDGEQNFFVEGILVESLPPQ